jgi:hypothetical protein
MKKWALSRENEKKSFHQAAAAGVLYIKKHQWGTPGNIKTFKAFVWKQGNKRNKIVLTKSDPLPSLPIAQLLRHWGLFSLLPVAKKGDSSALWRQRPQGDHPCTHQVKKLIPSSLQSGCHGDAH